MDQNQQYDQQTTSVMQAVLNEDSNCIDVGCHLGEILKEILEMAPKGTHFGFEPLPGMYSQLVEGFGSLDNVVLHNLALSDESGQSTFVEVVSNPGYSGLKNRVYPTEEQTKEIVVELNALDNVIPETTKIDLIKIDVEGAELGVLKGAVNLLKRDKPYIVFEHGLGAADCYGTKPEDVYTVLVEQCGLQLTTMFEWLENNGKPTPFTKDEFVDQFQSGKNYYFLAYAPEEKSSILHKVFGAFKKA